MAEREREMAERAVSLLLNKLASLTSEEWQLITGVWGEIRNIIDELERIRAFLRTADSMEESNQEAKVWVKQVRDVAYDIEDVIDEVPLLHLQSHDGAGWCGVLAKLLHLIKHLRGRRRIASKIKAIKSRLGTIFEGHQRYNNAAREGSTSTSTRTWHDRRGDALLLEEAELVGLEKRRNELLGSLLEGQTELKVVSVVGMGGMGKTTLVKKVYDSAKLGRHFQTHVWITVSQSFDISGLLVRIIRQLFEEIHQPLPPTIRDMDVDGLKAEVQTFLREKRYLLVLDDLWNAEDWEALKLAFPDNNKGSRVMLTTRSADTASTSFTKPYLLSPLSPEDSWTLFCRKAFRSNSCPSHLKELCRGILRRCEGLPLAIVAIGGLLATKDRSRVDEWVIVHDSLGAELQGNEKLESMNKILLLSYNDLPHYLKYCFLYFTIFPEDYRVKRARLIRLWIAEGFAEDKDGRTLEEVAESYLNELVNRSMIQIAETTRNRRVSTCRIHDLLREIALLKAKEQNFAAIGSLEITRWPDKIRRLSIHGTLPNILQTKCFSHLRSLFTFNVRNPNDKSPVTKLLGGCTRLLRVLDLQGADLETFPNEIPNLFHLRYLSLRQTQVKKVPSSIGRLINLETLDLKHTYVTELPAEILKLQKLRHLLLYRYEKGSSSPFHSTYGFKAPSGIGGLQSLQKLCFVEANHGSDVLSEMKRLTQLRRLGIIGLRREDGAELCSSVEKLRNLRSLDVSSKDENEFIDIQGMSSPPPYLQRLWLQGPLEMLPTWLPSLQSLVKLRLRWSRLKDEPLESLQALPNLVELQLRGAYDGADLHFKAGGFQVLKVLHLHDLEGLKRVTVDEGAIPCLEDLRIICCKFLEKVPSGIESLTKLKSLAFVDMQGDLIDRLRSKQGDDYLKIKNIPEIYYNFREQGQWKRSDL